MKKSSGNSRIMFRAKRKESLLRTVFRLIFQIHVLMLTGSSLRRITLTNLVTHWILSFLEGITARDLELECTPDRKKQIGQTISRSSYSGSYQESIRKIQLVAAQCLLSKLEWDTRWMNCARLEPALSPIGKCLIPACLRARLARSAGSLL